MTSPRVGSAVSTIDGIVSTRHNGFVCCVLSSFPPWRPPDRTGPQREWVSFV